MSGAVSSGSRKSLSVKLLKKTIKKNQTTFLILTAIESRFAFACVRAVCISNFEPIGKLRLVYSFLSSNFLKSVYEDLENCWVFL